MALRGALGLLVALIVGAGCGGSATAPEVTAGSPPSTTPVAAGEQFLRFNVPVGTEWTDVTTGTTSMRLALGDIEAPAGTLTPAEVDELRDDLRAEFADASFTATTTGQADYRVAEIAADGTHVVELRTTTKFAAPNEAPQQSQFVVRQSFLPDGSIRLDDVTGQDNAALDPGVREVVLEAMRASVEQGGASSPYKVPLESGASRQSELSVPVTLPLPGLPSQTLQVTGSSRTTYRGKQGPNHRFETSGTLRLEPVNIELDDGNSVAINLTSDDLAGEVVVSPDGRTRSIDTRFSMDFSLRVSRSDGLGRRVSFTIVAPLTMAIQIRPKSG